MTSAINADRTTIMKVSSKEGKVEYKDLCSGRRKGYSFKPKDLSGVNKKKIVAKIQKHIIKILEELQNAREIQKFYIGKTSTRKCKKADKLDPMNKKTLKKTHILRTWCRHKKERGYDGMVVVAVITKELAEALGFKDGQPTEPTNNSLQNRSAHEWCALHIEKNYKRNSIKLMIDWTMGQDTLQVQLQEKKKPVLCT